MVSPQNLVVWEKSSYRFGSYSEKQICRETGIVAELKWDMSESDYRQKEKKVCFESRGS